MSENTYQFAARQMPLLEAERAKLAARQKEIDAEMALLRPALKAAPASGPINLETAAPASEKPARGKPSLAHLLEKRPESEGVLAAVVNGGGHDTRN